MIVTVKTLPYFYSSIPQNRDFQPKNNMTSGPETKDKDKSLGSFKGNIGDHRVSDNISYPIKSLYLPFIYNHINNSF